MTLSFNRKTVKPGQVQFAANWEQVLLRQMEPEFGRAAKTMQAEAERLVPVDTGDLKASIDTRVTISGLDLVAMVFAREPYADFVEYGTGTRGARTSQKGVGRGREALKPPPTYQHGPSKGMRAQPFLRPAMVAAMRKHFRFGVAS